MTHPYYTVLQGEGEEGNGRGCGRSSNRQTDRRVKRLHLGIVFHETERDVGVAKMKSDGGGAVE